MNYLKLTTLSVARALVPVIHVNHASNFGSRSLSAGVGCDVQKSGQNRTIAKFIGTFWLCLKLPVSMSSKVVKMASCHAYDRSNEHEDIAFMNESRRLNVVSNVASLSIVANQKVLSKKPLWNSIEHFAPERIH